MATLVARRKSGRPPLEDYSNPLVLLAYSKICRAIRDEFLTLPITEMFVAHRVLDFITFVDMKLGKGTSFKEVDAIKLPACVFRDTRPDGPLALIVRRLLQFELRHGASIAAIKSGLEVAQLKGVDSTEPRASPTAAPQLELELVRLVRSLEEELVQAGYIRYPVVHVNVGSGKAGGIPKACVGPIISAITRHRGTITVATETQAASLSEASGAPLSSFRVGSAELAGSTTHILDWDDEVDAGMMRGYAHVTATSNTAGMADDEYIRTLDVRADGRVTATAQPVVADPASGPEADPAVPEGVSTFSGERESTEPGTVDVLDVTESELTRHNHNGTALVHWLYYPDSHDEWISTAEVLGTEAPDTLPTSLRYTPSCVGDNCRPASSPAGFANLEAPNKKLRRQPWRLNCRFAYDVQLFHEWGNEHDYEVDMSASPGPDCAFQTTGEVLGGVAGAEGNGGALGLVGAAEFGETGAGSGGVHKSGGGRGGRGGGRRGRQGRGGGVSAATRGSTAGGGAAAAAKEDYSLYNILDNSTLTTGPIMGDVLPPTLERLAMTASTGASSIGNAQEDGVRVAVLKSAKQLEKEAAVRAKEREEEAEMLAKQLELAQRAASDSSSAGASAAEGTESKKRKADDMDVCDKGEGDSGASGAGAASGAPGSTAGSGGGSSGGGDDSNGERSEGSNGNSDPGSGSGSGGGPPGGGRAPSGPNSSTAGGATSSSSEGEFPAWFDLAGVSAIEVRYLPEFFTGAASAVTPSSSSSAALMVQRNPSSYRAVRNFIIDMSRRLASSSSPSNDGSGPSTNYLSATDCRRLIAGDVSSVLRIHEFLDAFGIINQHVPPECRPVAATMAGGGGMGSASFSYASSSTVTDNGSIASSLKFSDRKQHVSGADSEGPLGIQGAASSADVLWSRQMDDLLLVHLKAHQKKGPSSATIDWEGIAGAVTMDLGSNNSRLAPADAITVTGEQCLQRFMTMPLDAHRNKKLKEESSQDSKDIGGSNAILHSIRTLGYPVAVRIASAAIGVVLKQDGERRLRDSREVTADTKGSGDEQASPMEEESDNDTELEEETELALHKEAQVATVAALQAAAAASNAMKHSKELTELGEQRAAGEARVRTMMGDYYDTRMKVMEEKMKLLEATERLLEIEMERQCLERRDIQIQRAALATSVANMGPVPASAFTVGGANSVSTGLSAT